MSENDIIAEYVRNKYPALIMTVDFSMFRLNLVAGEASKAGKEFDAACRKLERTMRKRCK